MIVNKITNHIYESMCYCICTLWKQIQETHLPMFNRQKFKFQFLASLEMFFEKLCPINTVFI